MNLRDPRLDEYLDQLSDASDPIIKEMELLAEQRDFPIVGPQVGRLLAVFAAATGARHVLELGSGFGYSAFWFARVVGEEGEVVMTEASEERIAEARGFLERGGWLDRVRIEKGHALEIAAALDEDFDIVFNDVDKEDYPRVLDLARARLRPGGLFISDNMLWSGKVIETPDEDADTRGVRELTRQLFAAEDFQVTVLPVRDGVAVAVKR